MQGAGIELRLAGTISAYGIDMHARLQQMPGDDGGAGLVGGDGGHDVRAGHCVPHAGADDGRGAEAGQERLQVAQQLLRGCRVDVEQAQLAHAQQLHEGQSLKFTLRAIADQRHAAVAGARQMERGHGGCGGSAQGRGQRQLADKARHAGGDIGQRAEGHHRGQSQTRIVRVAVDVFEGVVPRIGHRHQLDHAAG
ncbi:hypothetical protein SDC9_181685 [bioreactor metagenome]|uniref:Uncharacterized protein n=1 Tax=bioreactor metagenome TaxID=1076179 RepID=A0A645H760_9ZZZZ